jgi:hypothetical protein
VARESPPPARDPERLPVPSRTAREEQLIAQGYTIVGDRAVRRRKGRWRSLLGSERRALPPQGNTDIFLELAAELFEKLPWAPARIEARAWYTAPAPSSRPAPPGGSPPPG